MTKKITIRLDETMASQLEELSRTTQIPKVRLAKQAYALLFACYKELKTSYEHETVDLSLIDLMKRAHASVHTQKKGART